MTQSERHLVLYDGVCGLCQKSVQFILARDENATFVFATLQGEIGQTTLAKHGIPHDLDTFVLVENFKRDGEKVLTKSTGALRVAEFLGTPWVTLGRLGRWVPAFLRDIAYGLVAKSRYSIFGRSDVCPIPLPEHRLRFLDEAGLQSEPRKS